MIQTQTKKEQKLDDIFRALASSTRRDMLRELTKGSRTAGALGKKYRMSAPAITKHLRSLERADLVKRERVGREHRFEVRYPNLRKADNWIAFYRSFWNGQLDQLERHLSTKKN